ncbi:MAG: biotin/lipoyl-containing protein [Alphaproteobacteria bacterium]
MLEETGLSEIEIGEGPERVRVARAVYSESVAAAPASESMGTELAEVPTPVNLDSNHPGAVISPLVGVAYTAPEPGAPPFTKVGEQVSEGQTLFIVEAMKTMNPIRAPRSGRVARILAENGAPVEYGEVLLVLE